MLNPQIEVQCDIIDARNASAPPQRNASNQKSALIPIWCLGFLDLDNFFPVSIGEAKPLKMSVNSGSAKCAASHTELAGILQNPE